MILLHIVASLTTSVHALPCDLNPARTIHEYQDSTRRLANLPIIENALANTTNLTIPTIDYPGLNTTGAIVYCHRNSPPPLPQLYGHVDIIECALLIMAMLGAERTDLPHLQWSPTYPFTLPYIVGQSSYCKIRVSAVNARSLDLFQSIMVPQRAALVINLCPANNGGAVSLGPEEQFRVEVFSTMRQATA